MKPAVVFVILAVAGFSVSGCKTLNTDLVQSVLGGLSGRQELTLETIVAGLREALSVGTQNATSTLAQKGAYAKSQTLRIPLPQQLEKMASTLRTIGLGTQVDAFEARMNEAAEMAAAKAGPVFLDAIKSMTFADAKNILQGGDTAATDYFRRTTSSRLQSLYMPVVEAKLKETKAVDVYNALSDRYSKIPLVPKPSFRVEEYVTDSALTGLFSVIAQEERRIREDPAARTTALLRKVFGASG